MQETKSPKQQVIYFSTSLDFLEAVTKLVFRAGAGQVIIGDSCTFSQNTEKVMEKLEIETLGTLNPAPQIINFDKFKRRKRKIPNAKFLKSVSLPDILEKVDKLILLPCLKTHYVARFTGSLKLSVGFLSKSNKMKLHLGDVEGKITELNKIIKPNLIIMDGRKCFINKGPMYGEVREPNLILASTSRVAIDIEGIKIIQSFPGNSLENFEQWEIAQIKLAKEFGIG